MSWTTSRRASSLISWDSRLPTKTLLVPGWTATAHWKLRLPDSPRMPRKPQTLSMTPSRLLRMIRWFHEETGIEIGYKPAGGISTAKDALAYLALMKEELGNDWLQPGCSASAPRRCWPISSARARPV